MKKLQNGIVSELVAAIDKKNIINVKNVAKSKNSVWILCIISFDFFF
jgi:hypothetical protein